MRQFKYDVVQLIHAVRERPCLWDKTLEVYKDRAERRAAWENVFVLLDERYEEMTAEEKRVTGKLVQKRWKNLRACFSRELREQKSMSGQAANKRRKYKHFNQLLFLVPSLDTRETSENGDFEEDIDCEKDSDENLVQRSEYSRKKKLLKIKPYEERLLDIFNKKRADDSKFIEAMTSKRNNDEDKEKHFALSLVPLLKAIPEENKLEVQIQILKIFQEFQRQSSNSM